MSDDGVPLRLYRGHKLRREWVADIPQDDPAALASAFLAGVRLVTGTLSDAEAKVLAPDYRLEYWARVGGWTRFSPPKGRS